MTKGRGTRTGGRHFRKKRGEGTFRPSQTSISAEDIETTMNKRNSRAVSRSKALAIHPTDFEMKFKREKIRITFFHIILFLAFTAMILFGI